MLVVVPVDFAGADVRIIDDGGKDFVGNPTSGVGLVESRNIGAYQGAGVAVSALPSEANPRNGLLLLTGTPGCESASRQRHQQEAVWPD